MSALTKSLHPDEKVKAGKLGSTMTKAGVGLAVVMFLIVSLVLGADATATTGSGSSTLRRSAGRTSPRIAIGMLWLVLLHHLTRSRWSTVVRRIAEAMTGAFPLIWLAGLGFVLPVVFGYHDLYYWAHPDAHNAALNPTIVHKAGWLSPGFLARALRASTE